MKVAAPALIVVSLAGCARMPAPPPATASPPVASEVAPAIDRFTVPTADAQVVRARLIGQDGACDKYCWAKVEVEEVVTDAHISREIRVAYRSGGRGIAPGLSTLYLVPYNEGYPAPTHLWRLADDDGRPSPPSAVQVAASWAHALRRGDPEWLAELTAMPFSFDRVDVSVPPRPDEVSGETTCRLQLSSPAGLAPWLNCLYHRWYDETISLALAFGTPKVALGVAAAPPRLRQAAQLVVVPVEWAHVVGEAYGVRYDLLLALEGRPDSRRVSMGLLELTLSEEGRRLRARRLGYLALKEAIAGNDVAAVRKLLRDGVSPDEVGNDEGPGDPPITMAAERGQLQMVDFLLSAGADPNTCCCECVTALDRAIEKQHVAVVARLLRALSRPERLREGNPSPLDRARRVGNREIIRLLEDRSKAP